MEEQPSPNKKFNVMDVGLGGGKPRKRLLMRPAEQIVSASEVLVRQAACFRLTTVVVGEQHCNRCFPFGFTGISGHGSVKK